MPSSGAKRHRSRNHPTRSGGVLGDWIKVENLGRTGKLVVGIGLLVWLGWQVIGNTVADTAAQSDPRLSLAWRPDGSLALITLAESELSATKADVPTQRVGDFGAPRPQSRSAGRGGAARACRER